jgi:hypothetical protein
LPYAPSFTVHEAQVFPIQKGQQIIKSILISRRPRSSLGLVGSFV